jgi:hypothetical protein
VTVRKGEAWGRLAALPDGTVVVHGDAEARHVAERARRANLPVPPLGLAAGDLCRTMGGRGGAARLLAAGGPAEVPGRRGAGGPGGLSGAGGPAGVSGAPEVTVAPVDLGSILVDGRQHWFVAHAVARRSWWHGRIVVAMNAEFLGDWDVAPRGHPNDGRLDVLDVSTALSLTDRVKARRRLPSGTHVPHPAIETRQVAAIQVEFDRPTPVWLDGERVGEGRHLSIRVEPDALTCAV